jgi:hypothetical protein
MKPYPTEELKILGYDLETVVATAQVPTPDALRNFESYLEPAELEFYNNLPMAQKLELALSTDTFNAFKDLIGQSVERRFWL